MARLCLRSFRASGHHVVVQEAKQGQAPVQAALDVAAAGQAQPLYAHASTTATAQQSGQEPGAAETKAAAADAGVLPHLPPIVVLNGGNGADRAASSAGDAADVPDAQLGLLQAYDELGATDSLESTPKSGTDGSFGAQQQGGRSYAGALDLRQAQARQAAKRSPIALRTGAATFLDRSFTESLGTNGTGSDDASPERQFGSPSANTDGSANTPREGGTLAPLRSTSLGSLTEAAADEAGTSGAGGSVMRRGSSTDRTMDRNGKTMSLVQLQKAIEKIMLTDKEMYAKLQAGLTGIGSLTRETDRLQVSRDDSGATCINQYVVVKTLGRGAFGKVKLCLNTLDGRLYAVKMMNRTYLLRMLQRPKMGLRKSIMRRTSMDVANCSSGGGMPPSSIRRSLDMMDEVGLEIAIMKKMDHPNVVRLYEVIDPPGSQYMMLVMEYMEKGPVLKTNEQAGFGRFPEEVAADFFRHAVCGLEYLHYHKVVHGDIKPENLLVSASGELKIGDFGCSRMADAPSASSTSRLQGTPAFQAPEYVSGAAEDPFATDVWALAVCLYCFVYGMLPFQGNSVLEIFKSITDRELELPSHIPISNELQDLFRRIFEKDPTKRPTTRELMTHPWVTDNGRITMEPTSTSLPIAIEVTPQEAKGAIDRASLVSMIRARLKEKTFRAGEYLFKQGQTTNCVYFVMSGAVEVLGAPKRRKNGRSDANGTSQNGTGAEDEDDEEGMRSGSLEQSFTIDIDESLTLDYFEGAHPLMPQGAINGRLHIDRQKASDLRSRRRSWMMEMASEVVVDIKGPGQVVGEVIMEEHVPPASNSARAKGEVVALKLTQENYIKALAAMCLEAEQGSRHTFGVTSAGASRKPSNAGGLSFSSNGSRPLSTAVSAAAVFSTLMPPSGSRNVSLNGVRASTSSSAAASNRSSLDRPASGMGGLVRLGSGSTTMSTAGSMNTAGSSAAAAVPPQVPSAEAGKGVSWSQAQGQQQQEQRQQQLQEQRRQQEPSIAEEVVSGAAVLVPQQLAVQL